MKKISIATMVVGCIGMAIAVMGLDGTAMTQMECIGMAASFFGVTAFGFFVYRMQGGDL